MKKIFFAAVIALTAFVGANQLNNSHNIEYLSEITKANIEALALDPIVLEGVTCVPAENRVCIAPLTDHTYVEAVDFRAEK